MKIKTRSSGESSMKYVLFKKKRETNKSEIQTIHRRLNKMR